MLNFYNNANDSTNIYINLEVSNDTADDIWISQLTATPSFEEGIGIYEGTKLHRFNFVEDVVPSVSFLRGKKNIAFTQAEFVSFIVSWYKACVRDGYISDSINIYTWIYGYFDSLRELYEKTNVYSGALGYYETLALHDLSQYEVCKQLPFVNFTDITPVPEFSWILYDYVKGIRRELYDNYLTGIIQNNIREMLYKQSYYNRYQKYVITPVTDLKIPLKLDMTIKDIDFNDPKSVYYFCNPYDLDTPTNSLWIIKECFKVDKNK